MAFAVIPAARHPLDPFGLTSRGCKIRVMLRADQLLPPTGLSTLRFDAGRSPRRRQPATGPPGSYPDRTPTGWRARAYAWVSPALHLLSLHGAPRCWAQRTQVRDCPADLGGRTVRRRWWRGRWPRRTRLRPLPVGRACGGDLR